MAGRKPRISPASRWQWQKVTAAQGDSLVNFSNALLILYTDSSNRLQAAIDNLLDLVAMTTRQLQEAQETQRGLAETVEARNAEMETLTAKVDELDQHLKDETEARQFLAVELNKAEGQALVIVQSHKSRNASVLHPTMQHFVTEMCTCVHISVSKWCIVGYLSDALWDLWDGSIHWGLN